MCGVCKLQPKKVAFTSWFNCVLRSRQVRPDVVSYTSDYFEDFQKYAVTMIEAGDAFMDDTPQVWFNPRHPAFGHPTRVARCLFNMIYHTHSRLQTRRTN